MQTQLEFGKYISVFLQFFIKLLERVLFVYLNCWLNFNHTMTPRHVVPVFQSTWDLVSFFIYYNFHFNFFAPLFSCVFVCVLFSIYSNNMLAICCYELSVYWIRLACIQTHIYRIFCIFFILYICDSIRFYIQLFVVRIDDFQDFSYFYC